MDTKLIIAIAQWTSIIAGAIAAFLWFWSANVRLPDAIRHVDAGHFGETEKPEDDLDRLTSGLARQGRLSGCAALAAGISVGLQALATFMSL
ncbi:MAG: hypothetical protein WBA29_05450 [Xanthobacteraceae bacterium]